MSESIWLSAVLAFGLICFALLFAHHYRKYKEEGVVFPYLSRERVRFHEEHASCSLEGSPLGGATGCFKVAVTNDEVWLRLGFPANVIAFAGKSGLERRIAKLSIVRAERTQSPWGVWVRLTYRDEQGLARSFRLKLQKPQEFVRAVEEPLVTK